MRDFDLAIFLPRGFVPVIMRESMMLRPMGRNDGYQAEESNQAGIHREGDPVQVCSVTVDLVS